MGKRIKKLKKIRIHREGTNELTLSMMALGIIGALLWTYIDNKIPFWAFILVFGTVWMIALNFYRCPIRYFNGDSEKLVVAPADGKIVVVEDVDEHTYFHDKRLMISIFMSPWNVHANWFPVDGKVKFVKHFDGNYVTTWSSSKSVVNEMVMRSIALSFTVWRNSTPVIFRSLGPFSLYWKRGCTLPVT